MYAGCNHFTTGTVFIRGKCFIFVFFLNYFCTFAYKMMYSTDCNAQLR